MPTEPLYVRRSAYPRGLPGCVISFGAVVFDLNDAGERYSDDPRREVVDHLPPGRLVLDVGCNRGAFGEEVKRRDPARLVYGIEPSDAARFAAARLDEVVQGSYPDDIPSDWGPFDVITFNDVLEHMEDPWGVLAKTQAYLSPGGHVMAVLPNVRYIEVVIDLVLRGRWRYTDIGVLDRTHLRFFTRESMEDLFRSRGFTLETVIATHTQESQMFPAKILRRLHLNRVFADVLAQRYLLVACRP